MNDLWPIVLPFYASGVALTIARFWPAIRSKSIPMYARVLVALSAALWPMIYLCETADLVDERTAFNRRRRSSVKSGESDA